jgi:hypothetical protein
MGQYHIVINIDRGEYLFPHHLGDGLKLLEFGDGGKTMTALAVLLAMDNGRGIGDLYAVTPDTPVEEWEKGKHGSRRARSKHAHLIGSWAGQRIVIAGDYGDRYMPGTANLYKFARRNFRDISFEMVELLCTDPYLRESFQKNDWFQGILEEYDCGSMATSARRPVRQ